MKRIITSFLLVYTTLTIKPQSFHIKGKVSIGNLPVIYASIIFIDEHDTTKVYSCLSDSLGSYELNLITGVLRSHATIPEGIELMQNYPNPFSGKTTISYKLNKPQEISIAIYDILGREVKSFRLSGQSEGINRVVWDGTNNDGVKVATGVYLYQLQTRNGFLTNKMIVGLSPWDSISLGTNFTFSQNGRMKKHSEYQVNEKLYDVYIKNTNDTSPRIQKEIMKGVILSSDTTMDFKVKKSEFNPVLPGWKLVWHDEFDSTGIADNRWNYEVNGIGGGNNELQYYTANSRNVYTDDGCLIIEALKEDYLGKHYTSARLNTRGKGDWKYGRIEVRAKLPYGQGLWPAIWILPAVYTYNGQPMSSEIDIMEMLGQLPDRIYGTLHYNSTTQSGGKYFLSNGYFNNDFHLFAIEWDSASVSFFVDSTMYFKANPGDRFNRLFYLILNVAVGGDWPGPPNASTSFPQRMIIDYVRVYSKIN